LLPFQRFKNVAHRLRWLIRQEEVGLELASLEILDKPIPALGSRKCHAILPDFCRFAGYVPDEFINERVGVIVHPQGDEAEQEYPLSYARYCVILRKIRRVNCRF
jgi:hypothetical protein